MFVFLLFIFTYTLSLLTDANSLNHWLHALGSLCVLSLRQCHSSPLCPYVYFHVLTSLWSACVYQVGLILAIMGVFRLGFMVSFLADPVLSAFTTGTVLPPLIFSLSHTLSQLSTPDNARVTEGVERNTGLKRCLTIKCPLMNVGCIYICKYRCGLSDR